MSDSTDDAAAGIIAKAGGRCACVHHCGAHPGTRCVNTDGQRSFGNATRHSAVRGPIVHLEIAHLDHDKTNQAATNLLAMCPTCLTAYSSQAHVMQAGLHRARFPRRVTIAHPVSGQEKLF